VSQYLSLYA